MIGFIGFGKMGQAIANGLLTTGFIDSDSYCVHDPHAPYSIPLETLLEKSDLILICIKPQIVPDFLRSLPKVGSQLKCVVSIAAGVPRAVFELAFPRCAVIRAMPNTPATLGYGMTALSPSLNTSSENYQTVESLFKCLGKVIRVEESQLDAVTGISGSGPAFLYQLAKRITEVGVRHGLSESDALTLMAQTMIGAGHMLLESQKSPEELTQEVTSPGGTTEAGLKAMASSRIHQDISQVVESAIARSRELSKGA